MRAEAPAYTALAQVYDRVMDHVDYDMWADYLLRIIADVVPPNPDCLELACGTGSLTVRLAGQGFGSYLATDQSLEMLAVARPKLSTLPFVSLEAKDFTRLDFENRYDLVVMAYDSINYATSETALASTLAGVLFALRPGGFFLVDQSTPANSINNLSYFDDVFFGDDLSFSRTSRYDSDSRIHATRFVIRHGDATMIEHHEQWAFTRSEMLRAAQSAGFRVVSSWEAFSFDPADDETERVQWVLERPQLHNQNG